MIWSNWNHQKVTSSAEDASIDVSIARPDPEISVGQLAEEDSRCMSPICPTTPANIILAIFGKAVLLTVSVNCAKISCSLVEESGSSEVKLPLFFTEAVTSLQLC